MKAPSVDEIAFKDLYEKEIYDVLTNDGWSLVVTRYKPKRQAFAQPHFGTPVLCVHGFSQNRHAWTSGEFVKNLLYFGLDVHVLELRGHGKSSIKHQHDRWENDGLPLPGDIDYGWNFDAYALLDVPAAIDAIKAKTGHAKVVYIGHSMGGIIGYALASMRSDLLCLITVGSPAELGKDVYSLRAAAYAEPFAGRAVDAGLSLLNAGRNLRARLTRQPPPAQWKYKFIPLDWAFRRIQGIMSDRAFQLYQKLSPLVVLLFNPNRLDMDGIEWILKWGTHKEPRGVFEQLSRWIRNQEMIIYRTGYDIKRNYKRIKIPVAIVFGDRDILASMRSTSRIYRSAKSEYLLWRPVRGNSHIELTMGHDIRQICYDIKNIVEYAKHSDEQPARSLPRREVSIEKPN